MILRIDKLLADMGKGTRTEIKSFIKKELVSVNGVIVKNASLKVNTETDRIEFDNQKISYTELEYFILNKPSGFLSSTEDGNGKTVIDLISDKKRKDLFPVGRLDKDTEGLLLITNDGKLAHNLLSPKKHVNKTYYVETEGCLTKEDCEKVLKGININDEYVTKPAVMKILNSSEEKSCCYLTICEGKFHQVKRMMEQLNNHVTYLKRISMGPLQLPEELEIGCYRELNEVELQKLKKCNQTVVEAVSSSKALIFDMDGTIIDSMWMWRNIDIEFLGQRNIELPENLQQKIEGMNYLETANYFKYNFNLEESIDEIMEIWNKMAYDKYIHEVKLKDGVKELLIKMKEAGCSLGIATSNAAGLAIPCLEALNIKQYFDSIVTGDDIKEGKPSPEIYITCADNMKINPDDCLVFEDIISGILAGRNAGMRTCAVYDEYSVIYDNEKRTLADYYINSFTDIERQIK